MKHYIGVKIIEAEPATKNSREGYKVKYPDGYESWSPKEQFERAYYPMGEDSSKITDAMVKGFIKLLESEKLDDKTTMVKGELLTGFTQYEVSSCVDPKNYDPLIGADICVGRIKDTVWKCLGFVLQWGRFGLKE